MTMESFATPYPVLFHDGEAEHDKGHVGIHSVLSFKRFQSQMSRLIGIPANQLSTVFVCRRTLKDTEKRQKLPINETTNFNIILNQHNPSRERDCHFLVSLKKSKKERKGTRKRASETDNPDDEDSTSSRGDPSPCDERPKTATANDKFFSNEAASPTSILQRPVSPALSPTENAEEQINLAISANKTSTAPADKVERVILRRDGVTQSNFATARLGWPVVGPGHRVEGFNVNSSSTNMDSVSQTPRRPPLISEEHWKADKTWVQEIIPGRRPDNMMVQSVQMPQFMSPASRTELFKQGRFTDSALSQGFGLRPPTPLQRFGAMNHPPIGPIFSPFEGSSNIIPRHATTAPTQINAGYQLPNKNALMFHQMQTPFGSFPVFPSAERSNSNGGIYGIAQNKMDVRADAQSYTYCKFCSENQGSPPFHFCVNDRILIGFRGPSPAGPITRPTKSQLEATA